MNATSAFSNKKRQKQTEEKHMSNLKHFTDASFAADVLASPTPVLVDFYADWCGPCRMMAPVLDTLADKLAGKVIVGKVNSDENQEVSIKYNISGIPCLIIFQNGQEISRKVGYQSETALIKWINETTVI
jgi:thioredoxin 1